MTEMERIKQLEKRVDFLEKALGATVKNLDKLVDLMERHAKAHQTDCPWR
jgi:hypothetical protein